MRILLTGATGQVGRAARAESGEHAIVTASRPEVDITNYDSIRRATDAAGPDAILHCAAHTDVDGCERDPDLAFYVNALGTRNVALAAQAAGVPLVVVSTDYVFDGAKGEPYLEFDEPNPLSVYGRSKLAGERLALQVCTRTFVARTSWVYSRVGRNFPNSMLRLAAARPELTVVADEFGSPTLADDLAEALLRLIGRPEYGVYHLVNDGGASRYDLAAGVLAAAGSSAHVRATTSKVFLARNPLPARRPADSRLRNLAAASLGITLRPWREAVWACFGVASG
jgi:dTDP-4-dehydrorhamnose reductase